jgi:8-oxo-dGTP pyrophosphatase MutT (NUDIX family)
MARANRVEQPDAAQGSGPRVPLARLAPAAVEALARAALDPADGGPEIAPASDHDLNPDNAQPIDGLQRAAVLVPLIERPDGLTVLFTQRADQLRRHAGQIAFPGGRGEPGETAWQTALREAQEEIGLNASQVELIGLSTPFRLQTGFDVTPVVGFVEAGFTAAANPMEVAEVFETPFAFLMDPANHERRLREQPGPPRWHYAITYGDHVIWGATAAMLKALRDRLWGAPRV